MRLPIVLLGVVAVSLDAVPVCAQRIGIAFDPEGKVCSREVSPGDKGSIWVLAFFEDLEGPPIVAAQFRVAGLPEEWSYSDRSDTVEGWGIRELEGGVTMGFSNSIPRTSIIPLWRIDYWARVPETMTATLRIEAHPFAPTLAPLLVTQDDGTACHGTAVPRFTIIPTSSGQEAVINGPCTIDIERNTWQEIKNLYRE